MCSIKYYILIKFIYSKEILQSLKMQVKFNNFIDNPKKVNINNTTNEFIKMHNLGGRNFL